MGEAASVPALVAQGFRLVLYPPAVYPARTSKHPKTKVSPHDSPLFPRRMPVMPWLTLG